MSEVHEEIIDEPLEEVIVRFHSNRIEILSILWNRRLLKVEKNHSHWIDRSLQPPLHGFTVEVDTGDILELASQEAQAGWRIERLFLQ